MLGHWRMNIQDCQETGDQRRHTGEYQDQSSEARASSSITWAVLRHSRDRVRGGHGRAEWLQQLRLFRGAVSSYCIFPESCICCCTYLLSSRQRFLVQMCKVVGVVLD